MLFYNTSKLVKICTHKKRYYTFFLNKGYNHNIPVSKVLQTRMQNLNIADCGTQARVVFAAKCPGGKKRAVAKQRLFKCCREDRADVSSTNHSNDESRVQGRGSLWRDSPVEHDRRERRRRRTAKREKFTQERRRCWVIKGWYVADVPRESRGWNASVVGLQKGRGKKKKHLSASLWCTGALNISKHLKHAVLGRTDNVLC